MKSKSDNLSKNKNILVVPGLNFNPTHFKELTNFLNQNGFNTFVVKLSGFKGTQEDLSTTQVEDWLGDILTSYNLLKSKGDVYFLGYSLGGLLYLKLKELKEKEFRFRKVLLLAPAYNLKWYSHFIKFLYIFGDKAKVKSYSPSYARMYDSLPIKTYKEFFRLYSSVSNINFAKKLSIPLKVVIHDSDEFIDAIKLKKSFNVHKNKNISVKIINFEKLDFNHLLVSKKNLGVSYFRILSKEIVHFFKLGNREK